MNQNLLISISLIRIWRRCIRRLICLFYIFSYTNRTTGTIGSICSAGIPVGKKGLYVFIQYLKWAFNMHSNLNSNARPKHPLKVLISVFTFLLKFHQLSSLSKYRNVQLSFFLKNSRFFWLLYGPNEHFMLAIFINFFHFVINTIFQPNRFDRMLFYPSCKWRLWWKVNFL